MTFLRNKSRQNSLHKKKDRNKMNSNPTGSHKSSQELPKELQHAPLTVRLEAAKGTYKGQGKNYAGEAFQAELEISSTLGGHLIEIHFCATDSDDAFHEEKTWITEDLASGGYALWTVSTNTPGVLQHRLIEDTQDGSYSTKLKFRLGVPADKSKFRQEITLCIRHDHAIEYCYAWALPHEDMSDRSSALLKRLD